MATPLPEDIISLIATHVSTTNLFRDSYMVVSDVASLIATCRHGFTVLLYETIQEQIDPGCIEAYAMRNSAEFLLLKKQNKPTMINEYYRVFNVTLPKGCKTKQNIIDHITSLTTRCRWVVTKRFRREFKKYKMSRIARASAEGVFLLPNELEALSGAFLLLREVTAIAAIKHANGLYSRPIRIHDQAIVHPPNFLLSPLMQKFRLEAISRLSRVHHN
jgi:hypothetical protein